MSKKYCILEEERICAECGQCSICDLNADKICDNCMRCLKTGADYAQIAIDAVYTTEELPEDE